MNYIKALSLLQSNNSPSKNPTEESVFSEFAIQIREDISNNKIINYLFTSRLNRVLELALFMLSGSDSAKILQESGNTELDHCAMGREDLISHIQHMEALGLCQPEQAMMFFESIKEAEGNIGLHYGHLWRFWPRINAPHILEKLDFQLTHIPQQYHDRAKEIHDNTDSLEERMKMGSIEDLTWTLFLSVIDQVAYAVARIKQDQVQEPIVLVGYNPACAPLPSVGKKEQPMLLRTSVSPNPALVQIYVADGKFKKQLYFHIHLLQVDLYEKMPVFMAMFSLIAHLIARESDSEAVQLSFLCGEAYIHETQSHKVSERINEFSEQTPYMQVEFKNGKSLYDLTMNDLSVVEYSNQENEEND